MNELEKFAASIPSPVSREKRIQLIKDWKIKNNWTKKFLKFHRKPGKENLQK